MLISNIQDASSSVLSIKSYETEKHLPYIRKKGETPPKSHRMKTTPSDSAYQRTLLYRFQAPIYKMWNFVFLPEERSRMYVYQFFFLFFLLYQPCGPKISEEGSLERKSEVLVPFLSDQLDWKAARPPPPPPFSKSRMIKILGYPYRSSQLKGPNTMAFGIT